MGRIVILPDTLCNQIAAGEVVERPAAVVKELMENSIDAGSRRISVSLHQGGRREIRVVDNGTGMSPDDALLALERHATSKIRAIEDLQSIQSLGFRGEALPSIAAVSRFELITREPEAVSGTLIRIEGGILRDVRETGCPAGTTITVRDLFHNVPARRKFLRTVETEMARVSDHFLRLALAHPHIHFQLHHQERLVHDFPQTESELGRAGQVLGAELAAKLQPFSTQHPSVRLRGLVSTPELQRTNAWSLFVTVNGRPVWDRALNRAILSAYDSLLPKGKFPVAVLSVEIDSGLIDVNVHPTKREIRFRNPGEVLDVVRRAIRETLARSRPGGGLQEEWSNPYARDRMPWRGGPMTREAQLPLDAVPDGLSHPETAEESPRGDVLFQLGPKLDAPATERHEEYMETTPGSEAPGEGGLRFSRLPILGQLANAYILLEAPDGLVLIDQHAAHERIVHERLTADSARGAGQRLLQSVVIDLLPREADMLRRWVEPLRELGLEVESFGGDTFVVHAVPAELSGCPPDALIRDLLEGADESEHSPRFDLLAGLARVAACHGAIRAGRKLRGEEMRHLLEDLDRTPMASTCPHGRPLWFKLTHADIARLFHRT